MTLIAGTIGWGGVYLATDTRVTKKPRDGSMPFYSDDILKCEMLTGGLVMAVAGNALISKLLKEKLEATHIAWHTQALSKKKNGHVFTETPQEVLKQHVEQSLKDVFSSSKVMSIPNDEAVVSGMVAIIDQIPMKLRQGDCSKLLESIEVSTKQNSIISKYEKDIKKCSNGQIYELKLNEFRQGCLVSYESYPGHLDVSPVSFGEIKVFGSGASKNHTEDQIKTLGFMLVETEPNELEDVAFHLTRTHGLSDKQIPINPKYGFKTFGGGIVPTFLIEDPNNPGHVSLVAVELDIKLKPDGKLFSSLFHDKNGKLKIINNEGKDFVLTPFSKYGSNHQLFLELN